LTEVNLLNFARVCGESGFTLGIICGSVALKGDTP
jgi:hypothetical protein